LEAEGFYQQILSFEQLIFERLTVYFLDSLQSSFFLHFEGVQLFHYGHHTVQTIKHSIHLYLAVLDWLHVLTESLLLLYGRFDTLPSKVIVRHSFDGLFELRKLLIFYNIYTSMRLALISADHPLLFKAFTLAPPFNKGFAISVCLY
jgi:hypothetical protein